MGNGNRKNSITKNLFGDQKLCLSSFNFMKTDGTEMIRLINDLIIISTLPTDINNIISSYFITGPEYNSVKHTTLNRYVKRLDYYTKTYCSYNIGIQYTFHNHTISEFELKYMEDNEYKKWNDKYVLTNVENILGYIIQKVNLSQREYDPFWYITEETINIETGQKSVYESNITQKNQHCVADIDSCVCYMF